MLKFCKNFNGHNVQNYLSRKVFYRKIIYYLIKLKIQHATETNSVSKKARDLLETLMDFDNIPRKRPKFMVSFVILYVGNKKS